MQEDKYYYTPTINYIKQSLEVNYNIKIDKIILHKISGAYLYITETKDNKFVFKLYSKYALQDSQAFNSIQAFRINDFLYQNNFSVPKILNTLQNNPFVKIPVPDGEWIGGLFEFVESDDVELPNDFSAIVETTAKMHTIMNKFKHPLNTLKKDFYIGRMIKMLKEYYPGDKRIDSLIKYGEIIYDKVKNLPKGFSHGDYGLHNIHKCKDKILIFDFDTASRTFPMYDITLVCDKTDFWDFNINDLNKTKESIHRFADIYTKHTELSQIEIESFLYFLALRQYEVRATVAYNTVAKEGSYFFDDNYLNQLYNWVVSFFNYIS